MLLIYNNVYFINIKYYLIYCVNNQKMIKEKTVSRTGMVFNKAYGQHILINAHILKEMVEKSAIRPTDVVL